MLDDLERKTLRRNLLNFVERGLPPLVRIPVPNSIRDASWFRRARIHNKLKVFAFPAFQMGIFSGKLMPAMKLWLSLEREGVINPSAEGLSATSGNYGKDAAYLAPIFGAHGFTAVVSHNIHPGKLRHLYAAGAHVIKAPKGTLATDYVFDIAKRPGFVLMDQYIREESISGHEWTMNHIASEMERLRKDKRVIRGRGFVLCAVTGSCSTLIAGNRYLKQRYLDRQIRIAGVASMSKKEHVPGSRSNEDLIDLKRIGGFPGRDEFKSVLDFDLEQSLTRDEVYTFNVERIRQILLPVGPTGALLEAGFYCLLRKKLESERLTDLTNEYGEIVSILIWIDSYLPYIDDPEFLRYFTLFH